MYCFQGNYKASFVEFNVTSIMSLAKIVSELKHFKYSFESHCLKNLLSMGTIKRVPETKLPSNSHFLSVYLITEP